MLVLSLIFTIGCGKEKTDEEIFNDIQKTLTEMKSYSCVADITIIGNMKPQSYKMMHVFEAPDKCHIRVLEPEYIRGKTTIYNGKKTIVKQPKINQSWELNNFNTTPESKSFLGSFVYSIINNEQINISRAIVDNEECLVIETLIGGDMHYFKSLKLWMNIKKHNPMKLQVFDKENIKRIDIKYDEFKYNESVDPSLFDM